MESTRKLYIDCPEWADPIKEDDFIIAIGEKKSNSVYHVWTVKEGVHKEKGMVRSHVTVFKSDLITALKREEGQKLIPLVWHKKK